MQKQVALPILWKLSIAAAPLMQSVQRSIGPIRWMALFTATPRQPIQRATHDQANNAGGAPHENRNASRKPFIMIGDKVSRAEAIAAGAFFLNIMTLVFGGGVLWGDVQENTRRIAEQEKKVDAIIPKIERIDANVAMLAERAREDRNRR